MDYVPAPIWVFCMDTTTWTVYKSMVDMVNSIIIFCCVLEEYVKIDGRHGVYHHNPSKNSNTFMSFR